MTASKTAARRSARTHPQPQLSYHSEDKRSVWSRVQLDPRSVKNFSSFKAALTTQKQEASKRQRSCFCVPPLQ